MSTETEGPKRPQLVAHSHGDHETHLHTHGTNGTHWHYRGGGAARIYIDAGGPTQSALTTEDVARRLNGSGGDR